MANTIADRGEVIVTATGTPFFLLDPRPEDMDIKAIAHALSNLCRWTGHTNQFISVAQHCVHVSRLVPKHLALDGLLHDASEAYIGDISTPLKRAMDTRAPGVIRQIEDDIHRAVAMKFGTGYPHHPEVRQADMVSAATERRDLLVDWDMHGVEWGPHWPEPDEARVYPWSPRDAKFFFLNRFHELTSRNAMTREQVDAALSFDPHFGS